MKGWSATVLAATGIFSLALAATWSGASGAEKLKWEQPPNVDAAVPPVAPGVACSEQQVLHLAAVKVTELVKNVEKYSAKELIESSIAGKDGILKDNEHHTFNYVASVNEVRAGMYVVEEYRNGSLKPPDYPAQLVDQGIPAMALVFHPYLSGDFQMACEGQSEWGGKPAWQVHFRQRSDRPAHIQQYRWKDSYYGVRLVGRAWIAQDSGEVEHLETDLINPIPAIGLVSEHQVVDYGPVPFPKRNLSLWLPSKAELFIGFRGKRFLIRHRFSDFQLFGVDVKQEIGKPKEDQP